MMNRLSARPLVGGALALALTLAPAVGSAKGKDATRLAEAQALLDEAMVDFENGDFDGACPKLAEVVEMVPEGLGAMATLGECYAQQGKLASAWKTYVALEDAAASLGRRDRETHARKRAAALQPRLAQLTIALPGAVKNLLGLEITLDGHPVDVGTIGKPQPVDRGQHALAITATGKKRWETTVNVEEDGQRFSVELDGLKDERDVRSSFEAPSAPKREADTTLSTQRVTAIALGGAGALMLGLGTVLGLRAISLNNESNADGHCNGADYCDEIGYALRDKARSSGTASTVLFVAGGLAAAGGVTLFVAEPRDWKALVGVGPGGITLQGKW